ncbi:Txe/YoeB family addiction module toxin [Psychroflexus planctonicus]|uniref:Putative mRNA interferase YoeB n=1 Tax=Psychroflexus planctonicus TaxID=1526575 RepID=A0ABQ1SK72_9FLAO|nr:Txe/YoeB family addiction module toxin [Psychroflexus planctonicus]GGE39296.1 Txe/YoeB family addiction module toxin [Psychroflexus planctonicus]
MGNYRIVIKKTAKKDFAKHKKSGNVKSTAKISKIIEELKVHPYSGTGKPEQLKHELSGLWSRRINKKDRLIYEVVENVVTVYIISAMGHYYDK